VPAPSAARSRHLPQLTNLSEAEIKERLSGNLVVVVLNGIVAAVQQVTSAPSPAAAMLVPKQEFRHEKLFLCPRYLGEIAVQQVLRLNNAMFIAGEPIWSIA